jgi:prepilin-type N-terminal cleavage/methylation domain-containing protein
MELNRRAATAENKGVSTRRAGRGFAALAARSRRAFSLLELIVVLAIVAILGAIAAPRYASAVQRYRLEMAAKRVAADITLARSLARAKGSTATISFATSSSTYAIAGISSTDRAGEAFGVDLGREPFGVTIQSVDFAGTNTLTIKGFGVPTSGGTVRLTRGSLSTVVVVSSGTGEVSIQ